VGDHPDYIACHRRVRLPTRQFRGLSDMPPTETLLFVLGDQLDPLPSFATTNDVVLMAGCRTNRATSEPQARTALFLSAMRHYAERLRERQVTVRYTRLDDAGNAGTLAGELRKAIDALGPARLAITRPGEWRVLRMIERIAAQRGLPLVVHEDPHFLLTPAEFSAWANGRSELVMEHFYRMMRRKYNVLVAADGKPEGGEWNFDAENRKKFKGNRATLPPRLTHAHDAITTAVLRTVDATLRDLPGDTATFNWPVTREQAVAELHDFIRHRLRHFGDYQDAMVTGEPWLYHSLLSAPMNLKLLNPREIVPLAVEAYRRGVAPLNAVEGFVRQVMGWREFIRGVYWHEGPDYADRNALNQRRALPAFYWTGETEMHCLRESIGEVLRHGFGHHIQRLMVTGNFAMMAGADPRAVSDWYLGMYVDAVDWVTLPNTLGMSQHADGGVVGPSCMRRSATSRRWATAPDADLSRGARERRMPFTTFWDSHSPRGEVRVQPSRRCRSST
jgi:deoxyribodipyrimidine photolyase-related protein